MEELKLVEKRDEQMMMHEEEQQQQNRSSEELGVADGMRLSQARRNPPARNTSRFWFERFLAVIQRQNPSVIDSAFLSQIAPSNEGKLLAQLKFLHVIDEQGKPTKLLSALNMVGEEQKRGFLEITRNSYGELLGEVKVERAVPEDVVNYFIRRYSFTRDKGVNAARFFLYLAEKSSLPVSTELASFLVERERQNGGVGAAGSSGSNTGAAISAVVTSTTQRGQDRNTRPIQRDARIYSQRTGALQRKYSQREESSISATINITLNKDTPKEYWDRVLALLGETKSVEIDAQANSSDGYGSSPSENSHE